MLRHRGIRPRPENTSRSVPLQYISASDARRDARIAASKAFALSRERSDSETPDMFPEPYPPVPASVLGAADVAVPHHRPPAAALLQTRQSIRFVRQASSSNDFGPSNPSEAGDCGFSPSPSIFPDSKPSLTTTTSQNQRHHSIHNTWNGVMLNNKENIQGNGDSTVTEAAAGAALSSRSFLRAPVRRASFSFSSHEDNQIPLCEKFGERPAMPTTPSAVRLRRKSEIHLKRSLRRSRSSLGNSRPLTPSTGLSKTTVDLQEGSVVSQQAAEEKHGANIAPVVGGGSLIGVTTGVGSGITGSGMDSGTDSKGLRRTASRMSKKVKSRFRVLWGHSKSEACAGELPEQHIQARRSHGSLLSGPQFCSEDSGRRYSASISASMDNSKAGTVVVSRDEHGTLPGSQCGGDTSRFTSWSSSVVRRTSSNASYRASLNDYEHQQLPVISESGDQQQKQADHDANMSLLVSGLTSSRQRQQQQQQQSDMHAVSAASSSPSSPSLAGSGRGSTPRPLIAPEALRRLQELSLDLQRACFEDDKNGQVGADAKPSLGEPRKEILYAFQSTPTTPARAPTAAHADPTPGKESEQSSPPYFFRSNSPFRRALRESMNSFEEQTAARRTNARSGENDDDEPLLHPNGARQWSRVQAWQEGLKHRNNSSSSVSLSNYSQHSLAASRSQWLEQLHSETAVTPEQVRLWTTPVAGGVRCSPPWGARRHMRERAEVGEDDLESRF